MAADPVVLCLQAVTDYAQFERLCSDLMSLEGYPTLEPLGGFSDSGRDAIHTTADDCHTTIFAYSVREDWRAKLDEDAAKVRRHKHTCQKLVFLCNAAFTAGQRDKAVRDVKKKYKLDLDLFGQERLGTMLRGRHRHLIGRHPQVFTPAFFPPIIAGIDPTVQDFVFIDYAEADAVLAVWLARRLMAAGYRPWCRGLSLLAGERPAEVMDRVIRKQSSRVVAVYSPASIEDADAAARRAVSLGVADERGPGFLVPVTAGPFDRTRLDYKTRDMAFVSFERGWAPGLAELLAVLEAGGCPRPLPNGPGVAAQTFALPGLVTDTPERLLSNCFPVRKVPEVLHSFDSREAVNRERRREFRTRWAFRDVRPTRLVSFHPPPADVRAALGLTPAASCCWEHVRDWEGVNSRNLAMELVRKSLAVKAVEQGLVEAVGSGLLYFPSGLLLKERIDFLRPDGSAGWVQVCGERRLRRGDKVSTYCYHMAPMFFVRGDLGGTFTVLIKVRLHLTDATGQPLPTRTAVARRKQVCKQWWNHEWLSRTLAIASFMADGAEAFSVGGGDDELVVAAGPLSWEVPVGINEDVLDAAALERGDILPGEDDDADEDYDEPQVA
jgi:hypothetical protein